MSSKTLHMKRSHKVGYTRRLHALLKHPFFWTLTVFGNSLIVLGSVLLHLSEAEAQAQPYEFIDSLLWSAGIVTTIGYVNHNPVTFFGKVSVLILMLLGTLFVWSYMAFLVTALISPELSSLEKDMNEVERELASLKSLEEQKIIQPKGKL